MADKLNGETPGIGHNSQEMSQEQFYNFLEKYNEADEAIASAVAGRKDLRAKIKAVGGKNGLKAFDRARKDAERSGEARVEEDRQYRRMMEWQMKPIGYQPTLDEGASDIVAFDVHQLKRIDQKGYAAGLAGDRADRNPENPGSEAFSRWHSAWVRGQATLAESLDPADAPPKTPRGRPPGSKNKAKNGNGGLQPES